MSIRGEYVRRSSSVVSQSQCSIRLARIQVLAECRASMNDCRASMNDCTNISRVLIREFPG